VPSGSQPQVFLSALQRTPRELNHRLLTGKSGKPAVCARCRPSSRGNRRFARDADRQVGETGGLREMPIVKSGKPAVCARCRSSSPGNRRFARDADRQVRETGGLREMPIVKSGKPAVCATCQSSSPGSRRFPRHADRQVPEAWYFQKNLDANPDYF
jgi:hypothetical protein